MLNTRSSTELSSWLVPFFSCINTWLFEVIIIACFGFRELTTTFFQPVYSWPFQLNENNYPETKTHRVLALWGLVLVWGLASDRRLLSVGPVAVLSR